MSDGKKHGEARPDLTKPHQPRFPGDAPARASVDELACREMLREMRKVRRPKPFDGVTLEEIRRSIAFEAERAETTDRPSGKGGGS